MRQESSTGAASPINRPRPTRRGCSPAVPLLLLDLDNTLVDRAAAYRSWAQTFVHELEGSSDDVEWLVAQDGDGLTPRESVARAIAARFNLHSSPEAAVVQTLRQGLVEHMTLDPDVAGRLLDARTTGWTAVVVTNGTVMQQERKIRALGLEPLLAGWVISEGAGMKKPDPRIFQLAADAVGLPLEGGWMIGDHPAADIGGAHAVGLSTCWLRRGRVWMEAAHRPTLERDSCAGAIASVMDQTARADKSSA